MDLKKFLVVLQCLLAVFTSYCSKLSAEESLVLGIHPYKSSSKLIAAYTPLAQYLGKQLGTSIQINISSNYDKHIDAIGTDQLDIAYMGPASYIKLVDRYGEKPLLVRQAINGKPTFQGKIIVRKDQKITSLEDLTGKRFAFGDPNSTMSHLVPRFMLLDAGVTTENLQYFKFLGSHDNVALAVLSGDFDAGAVKEAVFYKYQLRGLRVLESTPELSEHLFVSSNKLSPALVDKLRQALMALNTDEQGEEIMSSIKPGITGMQAVTDADYDNLRVIIDTLRANGIVE